MIQWGARIPNMYGIKWLKVVEWFSTQMHFKFRQRDHSKSDQNGPPKWIPIYWLGLGTVRPIAIAFVLTI